MAEKDINPSFTFSHLRGSLAPPPERLWNYLTGQPEQNPLGTDPNRDVETFTVLSYNILCEKYATQEIYEYTSALVLSWEYRKELVLKEVIHHDPDFLCLQEVDIAQYEDDLHKSLTEKGYEGVYCPKPRCKTVNDDDRRQVDGSATFYKASKYKLIEKNFIELNAIAMQRQDFKESGDGINRLLDKDNVAVICLMENKHTGTRFIIANTHIFWNPEFPDVKLVQTALLVGEIEKIADDFAKNSLLPPTTSSTNVSNHDGLESGIDPTQPKPLSSPSSRPPPVYTNGTQIPLIICGDFNSLPSSGVYEFLTNGKLPANHSDFMSHMYGEYTSEGLRHRLGLKSAYAVPGGGNQLPLTMYTRNFQGVIDYIWYSTVNLGVRAVLGEVDRAYLQLEKVVGFPNEHFPSDHISIVSEFYVKQPGEHVPQSPPIV